MTARILVVDDVPANVKLLEVRLLAEYFEVLTATSGPEAIEICENDKVDVVLLDVMMPDMDGFEVCRRLKADPATSHIPVVMITALDQVSDRVRGLEAGADDFLTKPVNDLQLMTRVKSLVRLKMLTDELRLRAATTRDIGIEELLVRRQPNDEQNPKVLLIDEKAQSSQEIVRMLDDAVALDVADDPHAAVFQAAEGAYECVIVSTAFDEFDPLRLCSQLRSLDRTRFLPIILIAGEGEDARIIRALELGVNDYLVRPVDQQELTARLRTQVRRKRYNDHLRTSVTETIEMAVTDALTGLHNRRYLDSHLQTLFDRAVSRRRPLSVMMTDLDRFKSINDTTATTAATTCCASSPRACARTCAASTSPAASAARSSWWSCPTPTRRSPRRSPSASAPRSQATPFRSAPTGGPIDVTDQHRRLVAPPWSRYGRRPDEARRRGALRSQAPAGATGSSPRPRVERSSRSPTALVSREPSAAKAGRVYLLTPARLAAMVKKLLIFQQSCANVPSNGRERSRGLGVFAPIYPMMLRSAASPGSVGSAGRRWRIVASSYRCQSADRPLFSRRPIEGRGAPRTIGATDCWRRSATSAERKTPPGRRRFRNSSLEAEDYLIFVSLNSTCFLAIGSYLRNDIFSVFVRLFLLVT